MGTALTGNTIASSYLGLLKSTDSLAIGTSAKRITDGAGNDLPIKLTTTQMFFNVGTVTAPALSFDGNISEGFYIPTDENIGVCIAGSEIARFNGSGFGIIDGTSSAPSLFFTGDTDTGLYRTGSGVIGFSSNQTLSGEVTLSGFRARKNSTASSPNYTFIGDDNTGLHSMDANRLDFILGGNRAFGMFYSTGVSTFETFTTDEMAFEVGSSERLRILNTGQIKLNTYGSGTFTGTVTQRLGVTSTGQVVEIPIGAGALDGSGSAGKLAKFTDSDTLGDSIMSESSGNITINLAANPTSLQIGSSLADDPFLVFQSDGNTMAMGIDRSDSNKFKISDNATLGTNDRLSIDTSGNATFSGNVDLDSDSTKLRLGDDQDLEIYSNGSNGFIENSTGYLMLKSDTAIYLRSKTGNQPYINAIKGAEVSLFFNDSQKFETTNTGTKTTGDKTITGSLGVGHTSTPSNELHVKGDTTVALFEGTGGNVFLQLKDFDDSTSAFIGVDAGVLKFQTSGSSFSDKLTIDTSGLTTIKRTGITGVTKNDMTLHIGFEGNNGQNNLIGFGYNGVNSIPAYIGFTTTSGSTNTKGDLIFATRSVVTDTDPTERLRVDSNGNMGLSNTSMSSFNQLTTQGSAPVFVVGNGTANPSITIFSANDNVGSLSFADGTTTTEQYKGLIQYNHGTNGMSFYTDATERMAIDSSGNLSLATATSIDFNVADFAQIKFKESGAITIDSDNNQSSRNFQIKDGGGSSLLTVLDTGDLGLGTTSPKHYSGTTGTVLSIHSATHRGILELSGASNSDDALIGAITFANTENTQANGALSQIFTYTETSDSNAGDDSGGHLAFLTKPEAGTISEKMRITPAGEILKGIQTAVGVGGTPADANSTEIGNGYIILARDDTADAKQISFGKNGSEHSFLQTTSSGLSIGGANALFQGGINLQDSGTNKVWLTRAETILGGSDDDFLIYTETGLNIRLYTSGNERLRVDSSGNVSIGDTDNNGRILRVKGSGDLLQLTSTNTGASGAQLDLTHESSSPADDDAVGIINFTGFDSGNNNTSYATIKGIATSLSSETGDLSFITRKDASNYTEKMRLDHNGDLTVIASYSGGTDPFRVGHGTYSSFTPTFLIDDNGNVGVNVTAPIVPVHIVGTAVNNPSNGNGGYEVMQVFDDTSYATGVGGGIGFGGNFTSSNSTIFSEIRGIKENATDNNYAGALTFSTRANGGSITERLRIESDGTVQITNSTSPKLQLKRGSVEYTSRVDNNNKFVIQEEGGNEFFVVESGASSSSIRIDNSGNVGINDTDPFTNLSIVDSSSSTGFGSDDSYRLSLRNTDTTNNNYALISFNDGDAGAGAMGLQFTDHTNNYGDLTFITRGAGGFDERLRIKNDGAVRIATTSHVWNDRELVTMKRITGEVYATQTDDLNYSHWVARSNAASSSTHYMAYFVKSDGSNVGTITHNDTNTSFNTSSDYRLKEDLKDFNALDIASKIKMYDFKWKETDSRSYGVMAHELQEVLPQAVVGNKDGEDMQGVDYSKLVPILLKSIQELEARVQELEKEI